MNVFRRISVLDYLSMLSLCILIAHGVVFGIRQYVVRSNEQFTFQDLALTHCGELFTEYDAFQYALEKNPDCELNNLGFPATSEWAEYTQEDWDSLSTRFTNDGSLVVYDEDDLTIDDSKILITVNPENDPLLDDKQLAIDSLTYLTEKFGDAIVDIRFLFGKTYLTYDYIIEYEVTPGVDIAAFARHLDANDEFSSDAGDHLVLVNPNVVFSNLVLEDLDEESNSGFGVQSFDDEEGDQWHLDYIGYDEVLACLPASTKKVKIGVVDNGFDLQHPDLTSNIVDAYDQADKDDDAQVPTYVKARNHGTKEAGLIGAAHNDEGVRGIMPHAELIVIKSTKDAKSGKVVTDGIEAIATAYERGAKVINLSRGGFTNVPMLERVTKKVASKGVHLVAAAGNYNKMTPFYPAAYDWVIGVGAVDEEGEKASFSNYGSWVDISAPGVDMLTTDLDNTYNKYNGTSEAAPLVAGAIGLAQTYGLSRDDIRNHLRPPLQEGMGQGILDLRFMCDAVAAQDPEESEHASSPEPTQEVVSMSISNNRIVDGFLFFLVMIGLINSLWKMLKYDFRKRE